MEVQWNPDIIIVAGRRLRITQARLCLPPRSMKYTWTFSAIYINVRASLLCCILQQIFIRRYQVSNSKMGPLSKFIIKVRYQIIGDSQIGDLWRITVTPTPITVATILIYSNCILYCLEYIDFVWYPDVFFRPPCISLSYQCVFCRKHQIGDCTKLTFGHTNFSPWHVLSGQAHIWYKSFLLKLCHCAFAMTDLLSWLNKVPLFIAVLSCCFHLLRS